MLFSVRNLYFYDWKMCVALNGELDFMNILSFRFLKNLYCIFLGKQVFSSPKKRTKNRRVNKLLYEVLATVCSMHIQQLHNCSNFLQISFQKTSINRAKLI